MKRKNMDNKVDFIWQSYRIYKAIYQIYWKVDT